MSRVFAILLSMLPLLLWNKIRVLLTADGAVAALHEGPGLRGAIMRHIVLRLHATALTEGGFIALSFIGGLFFIAAGFFCDAALGGRAFGVKGNSAILVTGAGLSAAGWVTLAPGDYVAIGPAAAFVTALGSGLTLVAAALAKAFVAARLDDLASGARKPAPDKRQARVDAIAAIRRHGARGAARN